MFENITPNRTPTINIKEFFKQNITATMVCLIALNIIWKRNKMGKTKGE